MQDGETGYVAFEGERRLAAGDLAAVALAARAAMAEGRAVLIFDDVASKTVDLDLRGSDAEVLARIGRPAPPAPRGPGRPKLGVVAREVTLLPRHWDWLTAQPGGASVTLRRLVEEARRGGAEGDRVRASREAAYRFMGVMAGNLPGFEEAIRALFAGDAARFAAETEGWPKDVRGHARGLAKAGLG